MKMNLPNKLTMLRLILIPVFLVFCMNESILYNYMYALIVFVVASFTDLLDGHIARKYNLVTNFGKLMDPLADKLLVVSAMIYLVEINAAWSVAVFIIIAREFMVTSIRLVAASSGKIIAADKFGKYKTVSQMVWIIFDLTVLTLVDFGVESFISVDYLLINFILMMIATALTVFSGLNYLIKNREVFR